MKTFFSQQLLAVLKVQILNLIVMYLNGYLICCDQAQILILIIHYSP